MMCFRSNSWCTLWSADSLWCEKHGNCYICSELWSRNSCLMVTKTSCNRENNPSKVLMSSLRNCVRWRSTYAPSKFLLSWIYSRYFVLFENIIGLFTTMASVTVCSSKFFICMLYIKCFLFIRFEFTTFQFHWTGRTGDLGFCSPA